MAPTKSWPWNLVVPSSIDGESAEASMQLGTTKILAVEFGGTELHRGFGRFAIVQIAVRGQVLVDRILHDGESAEASMLLGTTKFRGQVLVDRILHDGESRPCPANT